VSCHDFEALLNPYIDGELPVTEVLVVERHLADCLVCRSQHEALEKLRAEIAASRLDYLPPPRLADRVEASRPRAPRARHPWWWGAGGLAAAALVLILTVPRMALRPDTTGREVLDAHLGSLLASHLVDVPSSDRHTVKPWFQGKVAFSPDVPDLTDQGFALVGGRLDVIRQQRAVALVYKRREHVINVFIAENRAGSPSGSESQSQGYNVVSWTDRGLSYWAVSDLNARELNEFAQLIRHK